MCDGAENIHDRVILGGGSRGYAAALRTTDPGLSVVLIEKAEAGGARPRRGCIPAKALRHVGAVADSARDAKSGIRATFDGMDTRDANASDAGVVGCRFASLHKSFGAEATVSEALPHLVPTQDEESRSSAPSVSAIGELVPTPQPAHAGSAQGVLAAERPASLDPVPIDHGGVPRVACSRPEVASVGRTEALAKKRHGAHQVDPPRRSPESHAKSRIRSAPCERKHIRRKNGPMRGLLMAGDRVGELTGEAQLIVNRGPLRHEVASLVHAHPTRTEIPGRARPALAG